MVHVVEDANALQLLVNLLLPGRTLGLQDSEQNNLFSSTYDGKFFVIPLQGFPASAILRPPPPSPPSPHSFHSVQVTVKKRMRSGVQEFSPLNADDDSESWCNLPPRNANDALFV